MGFKISGKDWTLAIIFGAMGFFLSSRWLLSLLNGLTPLWGFLFYESFVFLSLILLSKIGLIANGHKIEKFTQIIGMALVVFSFFILVDFTSPWMQVVTENSSAGFSNLFVNNSEDGFTWYCWSLIFSDFDLLRVLTYVITPFGLSLLGGLLIKGRPKLTA